MPLYGNCSNKASLPRDKNAFHPKKKISASCSLWHCLFFGPRLPLGLYISQTHWGCKAELQILLRAPFTPMLRKTNTSSKGRRKQQFTPQGTNPSTHPHEHLSCSSPAWLLLLCSLLQCTTPNNNLPAALHPCGRRVTASWKQGCPTQPQSHQCMPGGDGGPSCTAAKQQPTQRQRARAAGSQVHTSPCQPRDSPPKAREVKRCRAVPARGVPSTSSLRKINNSPIFKNPAHCNWHWGASPHPAGSVHTGALGCSGP